MSHGPFPARRSICRFSLAVCLCCAGCAVLEFEPAASRQTFKQPLAGALESRLGQDAWRPNLSWSVVEPPNGDRAALAEPRWLFGSGEVGGLVGQNRELEQLADRRDLIGWNAAILWARHDPDRATAAAEVLESLAAGHASPHAGLSTPKEPGSTHLPDALVRLFEPGAGKAEEQPASAVQTASTDMRAAAAEAWCLVLTANRSDKEKALAPAGKLLIEGDLPDLVRAELFRGLAPWIAPDRIPTLAGVMQDSQAASSELRLAAIEACLIHALVQRDSGNRKSGSGRYDAAPWPPMIENCRHDADNHVRAAFGRWSAVAGHPEAFGWLESQLRDSDLTVRQQALVSLGYVRNEAARGELRRQAKRSEEIVRAYAVRGLAEWDVRELVLAADDSSFIVRQEVAEQLARFPGIEASLLIEKLLQDPAPQVQTAALRAMDTWPNELAVRLLLHGLRHSSLKNRQECFQRLQQRIPDIGMFPVDGSHDERVAASQALAAELGVGAQYLDRVKQTRLAAVAPNDASRQQEIQKWLGDVLNTQPGSPVQAAAKAHLLNLGPSDVAQIERYMLDHQSGDQRFVFYELLPRLSPAYAALVELESSDVFARRSAAEVLSLAGAQASLSPLIARRLRPLLAHEQDDTVWRQVMAACSRDATEDSAQLALLAINHRWPDIRVLGCEHVARHGRPEQGLWVLPLLDDANPRVQLAAVEAAGRCHNPVVIEGTIRPGEEGGHPGLVTLLAHPNERLSRAAAFSLSRLGDARGMQELVRMSYHENPTVRREIAMRMGDSGRTRFIEHLVRMGHTEQHTQVQRAILESLNRLVPPDNRPRGLGETSDAGEQITRWVAWSQQQQ